MGPLPLKTLPPAQERARLGCAGKEVITKH